MRSCPDTDIDPINLGRGFNQAIVIEMPMTFCFAAL